MMSLIYSFPNMTPKIRNISENGLNLILTAKLFSQNKALQSCISFWNPLHCLFFLPRVCTHEKSIKNHSKKSNRNKMHCTCWYSKCFSCIFVTKTPIYRNIAVYRGSFLKILRVNTPGRYSKSIGIRKKCQNIRYSTWKI